MARLAHPRTFIAEGGAPIGRLARVAVGSWGCDAWGMTRIVFSVDVNASADRVFAAMVDWSAQGRWIPATTVTPGRNEGRGVGGELSAFTGVGKVGVLDTMVITRWDTPERVDVLHTGRVVRGIGIMRVEVLDESTSRFYWAEDLDLPLGPVGRLGWPLVKPAFALGMRQALGKFASLVEIGELGQSVDE